MEEWDAIRAVGMEAARNSGEILQSWSTRFTVSEKGPADLVTEADLASQAAIVERILESFPDHDLLGEEGLSRGSSDSPYRWVIDPLDGTSNYVHGFPYYAISIGVQYQGELVVGVIFDPNRDEMFSAVRGKGAILNGSPIRPSRCHKLADAFLVASLPRRAQLEDPAVRRFLRAIPVAESVQRTGSAALNLAYVACGRIDAFWSSSLCPWDTAAGAVIVSEASGMVTSLTEGPFALEKPEILAVNGAELHASVLELLNSTH